MFIHASFFDSSRYIFYLVDEERPPDYVKRFECLEKCYINILGLVKHTPAEASSLLFISIARTVGGALTTFSSAGKPVKKETRLDRSSQRMLSMKAQVDVVCCKSVGTDLSMLDIEDFITEICQLKKEVASLEAKLRERGDKLNREDVEQVWVRETDGTEAQDSVWSVRDQRSRDTQDSELSLTLLCYTDAQDHESTDQTSDCNAGEQQMPPKMCSVKLVDCRNLIESRGEETTAEKQQQHTDEEGENGEDDEDGDDDDGDFVPLDNAGSSSAGETASTSKEQCTVTDCGKTFSKHGHSVRHKKKDTEQKDFISKRCDISFPTCKERTLHSKEHKVKEFHCEQCKKDFFTTTYNMKVHMKTHEERSFQCNECNKFFHNNGNLTIHKRIHTGEKPYKCPQCEKRFRQASNLKDHLFTHTNERPFPCSECGKLFNTKQNLSRHKRIHTGEKPYKCPHCEKSFSEASSLKKHVRLHTNERPYQCTECGKRFVSSGSLNFHKKIHSDDKPFQCSHCEKRFRHLSHMITHERTHTGEKPYLCSDCGKSFTSSFSLKVHQRIHTGERPYPCSDCSKSFYSQSYLKVHQRTHTGEKPFKCSLCEKTFAISNSLKIHERIHTGEKPYCCSICGERFTYKWGLQTHKKKHAAPESS
ncbi:zinc finger protein 2-like [Carassius auratus]|uniref:Zinc finger protein 2-like n=1 Tax=Carassius auratus TaxID=7957 RepID=A0A6P6PIG2_CARAU|nr:zinc finger protein 2-like [Carassius auratus]